MGFSDFKIILRFILFFYYYTFFQIFRIEFQISEPYRGIHNVSFFIKETLS